MEDSIQNVIKGGENWMSMGVGRSARGILLWVKAIEPVEEFIAGLSLPNDDLDGLGAAPAAPRPFGGVRAGGRAAAPANQFDGLANAVQANYNAPLNPNEPQVDDLVSKYGKGWIPVKDQTLSVYRLNHELNNRFYTLNAVGQGFIARGGEINLSFLRFKGLSGPDGIKFILVGPIGRDDARNMVARVLQTSKQFFTEYIAPFNINLRISSTEI